MTHLSHRQRFIALVAAGALVMLTLGGLTWLLLGPSDDEPLADPTTTTSTAPTTSTTRADATPTTRSEGGDSSDRNTYPARGGDGNGGEGDWEHEPGLPLPPMGIAETSLNWTDGRLPFDGENYWLHQLFEWDGRIIASGGSWDETTETESTALFESTDGIVWTAMVVPPELQGGTHIVPAGDTVVAFVNRWEDDTADNRVYVSDDLITWRRVDLSGFAAADEALWLWHAAGTGETLIIAGNREPVYTPSAWDQQPVIIKKDGLTLEIDNVEWSYLITDDATGEVMLHGSLEEMWDDEHDEGGAVLYDPVTGIRVFHIPWADLNEIANEAHETAPFGGEFVLAFESDGRRMTLDEFTGAVVVTEIATGDIVFTGTEGDLWQGRPPTFVDPRTDTVVLRLTWDEWNRAHEETYPDETEPGWQVPEGILLVSRNGGATFTEIDLASRAGQGFQPVAAAGGPAGFLLVGHAEGHWLYEDDGMYEPVPIVLASPDGVDWTRVTTDLAPGAWVSALTSTADGFIALAGSESGSMVLTTEKGTTWSEFLTGADLQLPLGSAWFEWVSTGEYGVFVTGSRDGWEPTEYEPEPLVVSKQGRTLTIDGPLYTLVDDATGAILFDFDEEAYWEAHEPDTDPEARHPIRWGEGGLAIFTEEGSLLFALSHEEQWRAEDTHHPEQWYEPEQILLRHDGETWSGVELPVEMGPHSWFSAVSAGDDRIVLVVNVERPTDGEEWTHELMVFVGTD